MTMLTSEKPFTSTPSYPITPDITFGIYETKDAIITGVPYLKIEPHMDTAPRLYINQKTHQHIMKLAEYANANALRKMTYDTIIL